MASIRLTGGCLCGAVRYEAQGEPERFYHCHCRRCRKSSGTGHATNLMLGAATLVFTEGEALVRQFKVPDAERFTRQFCSVCGSSVAREAREIGKLIIPAGSLDSPLQIRPDARIFRASRAEWSCDDAPLPRHAEYGP